MKYIIPFILSLFLCPTGSFAGELTGEPAEKIVLEGEVLASQPLSLNASRGFELLIRMEKEIYFCTVWRTQGGPAGVFQTKVSECYDKK